MLLRCTAVQGPRLNNLHLLRPCHQHYAGRNIMTTCVCCYWARASLDVEAFRVMACEVTKHCKGTFNLVRSALARAAQAEAA